MKGRSHGRLVTGATKAELASYNRFCEEYGDGGEFAQNVCILWDTDRPFSTLKLSELNHPWCDQWSLSVDPEVNAQLSAELGYYCSSRSIPSWCEWAEGMGYGPQIGKQEKIESQMIIPVLFNPASKPVNFPHCRRRKLDAEQ